MSGLTIFDDLRPEQPVLKTTDAEAMARELAAIGVRFERWESPVVPALRQKFLSEHIHTEDEIRFFVHGGGHFVMHVNGRVYDAFCVAGDLISVPANTKHWFDAGEAPNFTALRVFTDTTGWTPHYTGDAISERFALA
jgi:1,2-dihydroxy-3-keto-5-methylthiopentene dioxygenase